MDKTRKKNILYASILGAFLLGAALGILMPEIFGHIAFLGDLYVRLLKLIVIPLLMTQVTVSVAGTTGNLVRRIVRVIALFVVMFAVSFCIMALITGLVSPGTGVKLFDAEWEGESAVTSISGFFDTVVRDNIFSAMTSNAILPCILFALVFGIALARVKAEKTIAVLGELGKAFSRILEYIMYLTPVGVFVLMGNSAASYGPEVFGVCAGYILLAWGGCLAVTLIVMVIPVWIYAGITPWQYVRKVSRIWILTLSTCSSAATLPSTIRVCNEEFGIPKDITDIVVPLGCTIHMCGGAVSFCLLGMFTMQMAGITIGLGTFLYMLLVATLMNMAAPGIPGGGIALGAAYLGILGAPTGFIGMYSGIYRLLDMPYTTLNVTGDITANILIAESEKRRTARK
ncbi:MAG: dicarboxylate/amino acid:cation symporter [Lachnospiraceae bacterium]|nr:dicarboxylate/amino acid:cation symporter [Lachnospiraceae bacterium]